MVRRLGGVAVVVAVAVVGLAPVAAAQPADTPPVDTQPARTVQSAVRTVQAADGFADVTGGVHKPAIDALAERGVFDGTECAEDMFCPGEEMKRWTMAVWLVRVPPYVPRRLSRWAADQTIRRRCRSNSRPADSRRPALLSEPIENVFFIVENPLRSA